jgi:hypothetical protein
VYKIACLYCTSVGFLVHELYRKVIPDHSYVVFIVIDLSPHLRRPNPGFNPGFTPLLYNKCGGEPRVKLGVWPPEMWTLVIPYGGK